MIHPLRVVRDKKIQESIESERGETNLIHEHYFVAAKLNELNQFVTCCITCGDCYCNICGKLLVKFI